MQEREHEQQQPESHEEDEAKRLEDLEPQEGEAADVKAGARMSPKRTSPLRP